MNIRNWLRLLFKKDTIYLDCLPEQIERHKQLKNKDIFVIEIHNYQKEKVGQLIVKVEEVEWL